MAKKYLIISDIHDNKNSIEKLYEKVHNEKFHSIFFCGDIVAPFTINNFIEKFEELTNEFLIVLGNNEGEIFKIVKDLSKYPNEKLFLAKDFIIKEIEGKKTLITHGWGDVSLTRTVITSLGKSGDYKFIFFGHTHQSELTLIYNDDRVERSLIDNNKRIQVDLQGLKTLIINPGELGGWLSNKRSYVLLELDKEHAYIDFNFI